MSSPEPAFPSRLYQPYTLLHRTRVMLLPLSDVPSRCTGQKGTVFLLAATGAAKGPNMLERDQNQHGYAIKQGFPRS